MPPEEPTKLSELLRRLVVANIAAEAALDHLARTAAEANAAAAAFYLEEEGRHIPHFYVDGHSVDLNRDPADIRKLETP